MFQNTEKKNALQIILRLVEPLKEEKTNKQKKPPDSTRKKL